MQIKDLLYIKKNLKEVINCGVLKKFHIEQKTGNLRYYFTARVNNNIRLIMRPIGEYPYNLIEIEGIEFVWLNNKHYKGL